MIYEEMGKRKYPKPPAAAFDKKNGKNKKFPYVDYNPHAGHRKRLRAQIIRNPNQFNEHQMLEALLFCLERRKDTNVTAHYLIDYFGNFGNVFKAKRNDLMEIRGVGPAISLGLKKFQVVFELSNVRKEHFITFNSIDVIAEYYETTLEGAENDGLWVSVVDNQLHLLCTRRVGDGGLESDKYNYHIISNASRSFLSRRVLLIRKCSNCSCFDKTFRSEKVFEEFEYFYMIGVEIIDKVIIGKDGIYFVNRREYVPFVCDRLPLEPESEDEYCR